MQLPTNHLIIYFYLKLSLFIIWDQNKAPQNNAPNLKVWKYTLSHLLKYKEHVSHTEHTQITTSSHWKNNLSTKMYAGKCEHTKYQLEDLNSSLHLPLKSVMTLLKLSWSAKRRAWVKGVNAWYNSDISYISYIRVRIKWLHLNTSVELHCNYVTSVYS